MPFMPILHPVSFTVADQLENSDTFIKTNKEYLGNSLETSPVNKIKLGESLRQFVILSLFDHWGSYKYPSQAPYRIIVKVAVGEAVLSSKRQGMVLPSQFDL